MEFGRGAMPVMMMSWSNPENMCAADRTSERASRYQRTLGLITNYLAAEIQIGRLRPLEPEVAARMLLGSLHHYCMIELFVGAGSERFTHRQFAEQVVDVLLASAENRP
jgi:AcrR family transcriptional regulator